MENTLHKQLIQQAEQDGWVRMTRGGRGDWRAAFRKTISGPHWCGEADGLDDAIKAKLLHPDAWRMKIEGTASGLWSYDVLVLEFLEVEVTSKMSTEKKQAYEHIWIAFDTSALFVFRVFHMDRFGVVRLFLTENTIHTWRKSPI